MRYLKRKGNLLIIFLLLIINVNEIYTLEWYVPSTNSSGSLKALAYNGNRNKIPDPPIKTKLKPINYNLGADLNQIVNCTYDNLQKNLNGTIAVVQIGNGCPIEKKILNAQNAGALGVIVITNPLYYCNFVNANHDTTYKNITIPAICIETTNLKNSSFLTSLGESMKFPNRDFFVVFQETEGVNYVE
eukprot:TRINITY_DN7771_c0_g1_i1.p1 TRINITY_DN7771_c0_g1~~TRINITY_DN7771_c0_g1_i1.p1  ORF type:complete len:188 (-),score=33.87 TRINITY_DN7771_c0_g1_i1:165-728(-)